MVLKKRGASDLGELFFAAVILTIFGLVVNVFVAIGAPGATPTKAEVGAVSFSKVCDADLVNFLRAGPSSGKSFAELIALTKKDLTLEKKLADEITKFMDANYRRGSNQKDAWLVAVKEGGVPSAILPIGSLTQAGAKCSKIIPSFDAGLPLTVELSLGAQ